MFIKLVNLTFIIGNYLAFIGIFVIILYNYLNYFYSFPVNFLPFIIILLIFHQRFNLIVKFENWFKCLYCFGLYHTHHMNVIAMV